jgi:hypothetical protein
MEEDRREVSDSIELKQFRDTSKSCSGSAVATFGLPREGAKGRKRGKDVLSSKSDSISWTNSDLKERATSITSNPKIIAPN